MKLFKLIRIFTLMLLVFSKPSYSANDETTIYEKIDIFSDVLDKINKEYVDEINQNEVMDAAIKWSTSILGSLFCLYVSRDF